MDFGFRFRDHVLSHTVYKPGGVTETSHCCLSSYHNLQVSRLCYIICCLSSYHDLQSILASHKHLLRYVAGTIDFCLLYKLDPHVPNLFRTFSDADLAGNVDTGRSTTGYVVKMGTGAVSWSSKLQSIVALSTTEAEFVAAVSAGQESIWMSQFLAELGYNTSGTTPLLMDNQSAIQVARNPEHHGRMQHLDLRYFWLCDEVVKGHLAPRYIPTAEMAADILTKVLTRVKVKTAREQLGLFPIPKDLHA
jgi:hypothetical protein